MSLGLILLTMFCASCARKSSNTCPYPIAYSDDDMLQAADELGTLPRTAVLFRMMADYGRLRAKLRECLR